MLHDRVTSNDIARVVAKATGIPVQNLLKGEKDKLVHVSLVVRVLGTMLNILVDGGHTKATRCGTRSRRRGYQ